MFYYVSQLTALWSPLRVFQYTTFRAVGAAITALLICVVTGPWVIRKLAEFNLGQPIRGADDLGNLAQKHGEKQGTPILSVGFLDDFSGWRIRSGEDDHVRFGSADRSDPVCHI